MTRNYDGISHQERENGDLVDEDSEVRGNFRGYPLTLSHDDSILGTSDDTLSTHARETSAMAKTTKKPKRVGYAAVGNMRKILDAHRNGGLPDRLTPEKIEELGVPRGDAFHVKNALEDLTFLNEAGYPTPQWEIMASVSEDEYRKMLAKVIRNVYSDALKQIPNLARATSQQYYEAFSVYAYPKQHRKMIALFKELCQEAGLMDETETPEVLNDKSNGAHPDLLQEASEFDIDHSAEEELPMGESSLTPQVNGSAPRPNYAKADELGELVIRLLQLPQSPGWTEADREWWQQAVYSASTRLAEELKGRMKS